MPPPQSAPNQTALQGLLKAYIAAHGRDQLISEAGISITTLTSLLTWEFEWTKKKTPPSERQRRAWAKTFVRLAHVLENTAEEWIKAIGWELGHELQEALKKGQEELALRKDKLQEAEKLDILQRVRLRQEIKVGCLTYGVLGLGSEMNSFHHRLVERLFGTLAPGFAIAPTSREDMDGILNSLVEPPYAHDVVIGVLDTPARRFYGVNFIPLRGWTVHINGVYFQRDINASPPDWWSLSRPRANGELPAYTLMAIPKEAAHAYFSGTCGFSGRNHRADGLHVNRSEDYLVEAKSAFSDTNGLAEEFETYAMTLEGGDLIFVADDETCRRVRDLLNAPVRRKKRGGAEARLIEEFESDSRSAPFYTLAIAVPLSAPSWMELIRETVNSVTYGTDWKATAELYADQIATAHLAHRPAAQILPDFFDLKSDDLTLKFWGEMIARIRNKVGAPLADAATKKYSEDLSRLQHKLLQQDNKPDNTRS